MSGLAWNYVDLDARQLPSSRIAVARPLRATLLSFERPPHVGWLLCGRVRAHLENSIAANMVFFLIKRIRAHGGCLGAKSR